MKNVFKFMLMAISSYLSAQPCNAQEPRIGLWEQWMQPNLGGSNPMADIARRIDESNRKFKEKLAAMEPEKRSAVEREMAASGIDLRLEKPDGVMSTQICIDAKEAARLAGERERQKTNCKREVITTADDVIVVHLQCKEKYNKELTSFTIAYYGDKAQTINSSMGIFSMRWLSDDCGKRGN